MRLFVYLLEAKGLPVEDSYVKLKVGKLKSKTRVSKKSTDAVWNEEFVFKVRGVDEILDLSVYQPEDDLGFFNGSGNLVGRVRIPVCSVTADKNQSLHPTWFPLERPKKGQFINEDCGKILLTLCLHGKGHDSLTDSVPAEHAHSSEPLHSNELEFPYVRHIVSSKKIPEGNHLMKSIASHFEKLFKRSDEALKTDTSSDVSTNSCRLSDYEDRANEPSPCSSFEEAIAMMHSRSNEQEMPESLQGGILLDQTYRVSSEDLNTFLFAPNSQFRKDLAELQGTTDIQEGPWEWTSGDISCLTRIVTYTKGATKLVKAVKTTEEQTYKRADGKEFCVLIDASTPDVPYGNTFKIEMLYKIMPGPELPTGEESSHLEVSWGLRFNQSTLMKGMIEGGAKQGLKESFGQFSVLLAQNFKRLDSADVSDRDRAMATLQTEQQSNLELAIGYFWNFTAVSTTFMLLYVLAHISLSGPSKLQGLEFYGLDLPDSLGELITAGILVIQLERVYYMVVHFIQARLQRVDDHGVRAQGSGWILTVTLVEGTDLASLDLTGSPDPFVVFTCNGKTRTSSVKLQTSDPQWNEIFEFDATEEPPAMLDVQVFDFDGPFNQSTSFGDAEINFLKHTPTELADMWAALEGNLAQTSQSKVHLRIFLDNKKGAKATQEYLMKIEKEVGKKMLSQLKPRSHHSNSAFQKLFSLPPEEFLISDFSCYLKRKMPLQGRLFLSARMVGFYANLLVHKTKFFFLWEDIADIQVVSPSLKSVGSLIIVLQKGRGLDARHGAKSLDEEGRLVFCFHSFVPFNVTTRIIIALWRARTLTADQKAQVIEEEQDLEDAGNFLNDGDVMMSKVYSVELPVNIKLLMEVFDGGYLEQTVMGKSGCLNYVATPWELVKPDDTFERQLYYEFNHHISIFNVKIASRQRKSAIANDGCIVDEVMILCKIPFGDHFRVHFRYQIENSVATPSASKCEAYIGIKWLKSFKFQQRISRNITKKFIHRLEDIFELAEKEILQRDRQNSSIP